MSPIFACFKCRDIDCAGDCPSDEKSSAPRKGSVADLRAQLAAVTAERDALKAETKRLTDAATEARQLLEYAESRWDRIRRNKGDDADRAELSSNLSYALGKLDAALAPKP